MQIPEVDCHFIIEKTSSKKKKKIQVNFDV